MRIAWTQTGYYSSEQKDVVRAAFQLPLIEDFYRRRGTKLRYLGLPGEEARDIGTWGHVLAHVEAVEVYAERLSVLESHLDTHYPNLRYRSHWENADRLIIANGSRLPGKRGPASWHPVTTEYEQDVGQTWKFDVLYLDYFGKFLPSDYGSAAVQMRARALRRLFDLDRQDSWQPWLLMLTVESTYGRHDRELMRNYLQEKKAAATHEVAEALDFRLKTNVSAYAQAARLVTAVAAYLVSIAGENAGVNIKPRPAVVYSGAGNVPMLHLAWEVTPGQVLVGMTDLLSMLRTPTLTVREPCAHPWFQLQPDQPPGLTTGAVQIALDFLGKDLTEELLAAVL